jgi:hypothetical protein
MLGVPVLAGLNVYRSRWAHEDERERNDFIDTLANNRGRLVGR